MTPRDPVLRTEVKLNLISFHRIRQRAVKEQWMSEIELAAVYPAPESNRAFLVQARAAMNLPPPLANLVNADLIRPLAEPDPAFLFKHALVQDTAYESLLKQERKRLHRFVAASIEQSFPHNLDEHAARLTEHYWLAEDWAPAAAFALKAGARAQRLYALREAMSHYGQAQAALARLDSPRPDQLMDAILGWAEAAFRFTPYEEQLARLHQAEVLARETDDKSRLAHILYQTGQVHVESGHNLRAAPVLAECFTLAADLGDERLTILPTYYMGSILIDQDPLGAIELFDRAIELARKHHQPDTVAAALGMKGMAQARRGDFDKAEATTRAALHALEQVESPMTASDVLLFAAWSYLDMGQVERGLELGQMGVDKAIHSENMDCVCFGFACLGFGNLQAGRFSESQAAFGEAVRRSRYSGAQQVENLAEYGLALVHFMSGRTEALVALEAAYETAEDLDNRFGAASVALGLGEIFMQSGDLTRAVGYLDAAIEYFRRTELRPYLARAETIRARLAELESSAGETARVESR